MSAKKKNNQERVKTINNIEQSFPGNVDKTSNK